MHQTKNSSKTFEFFGKIDFLCQFEILQFFFFKLTPDFESRYKHRFKTTAGAMKDQSIYSYIL